MIQMQPRDCPVCETKNINSMQWLAPRYDLDEIDDFSFASRKLPEYMTWGYRLCKTCRVTYCSEIPSPKDLATFYHESHFSSADEAKAAADTYAKELTRVIDALPHRETAIDIGCGPGPLLKFFNESNFAAVCGVEPSIDAIDVADETIKKQIKTGNFSKAMFQKNEASMICLFQTIEHLSDPKQLFEDVYHILKPGGVFVVICHNRDSWLNKLLGSKSPIIDIEHLQLFNPSSLKFLAKRHNLDPISLKSFNNKYPLSYWMLLVPMPKTLKLFVLKILTVTRLARLNIKLNVGNMIFVCQKKPMV